MRTVLVAGGAGFIGSNFILYVLSRYPDYRVINLDKLTYAGNLENLRSVEKNPRYRFEKGDVCDAETVERLFQTHDIDFVVNFAAESHVDRSIRDPGTFIRTNVLGATVLIDCARRRWSAGEGFLPGKKFLQVSTDEVYGSLGATGYFTEETPLDPHSPYAASKAGADFVVKAYFDTYGMPANITRCSNNYGPFQFPEKLIPLTINNALNKKPVPVYGDGLNIRDWLYVEDHCRALDAVLHRGRAGEIYNVGGHNEQTNIAVVRRIIACLNRSAGAGISEDLIRFVKDRQGHDRRYGIDPSKIRNELGWRPEFSFEEGMDRTIRWYLDNPEWLANVTSGEYRHYYRQVYGTD